LIAIAATGVTLATVAPETNGPGVTCDELYHVAAGKKLVLAWRQQGIRFFDPANIRRNFPWTPEGPPFHPPLGHWILGWTHHLLDPAPDDLHVISITAARFAAAFVLGLTAMAVGMATLRLGGTVAGTAAAAAVVLSPRLFGHSHLASLDPVTGFFFAMAVFAVIHAEARGDSWWRFALAGFFWGLAMLTRLHGLLLAPPVILWLLWNRRPRIGREAPGAMSRDRGVIRRSVRGAVVPIVVWLGAGLLTLFAGWPWLWLRPIAHLKMFIATGTGRQALNVFYAGRVWADRDVPWHYPFVMFAVTVPLGLLMLGLAGMWAGGRRGQGGSGYLLVIATMLFVLCVFAWPGTPVYDGVRLFLLVFPLWAVSIGLGAQWLVEVRAWGRTAKQWRLIALGVFLVAQGVGLVVYLRCPLSYYSLLVGGLPGAEKLGFETTYWGDSVGESLLAEAARVAAGQTVVFGPSLAPFQAPAVWLASPALSNAEVQLIGWESDWTAPPPGCRYGLFYHRKADLATLPPELIESAVVSEHRNQGVWLAKLVRFAAGFEPQSAR
jgi:4-amino-4-deoxy-L-arabinose transferase-like glycosyltransferase